MKRPNQVSVLILDGGEGLFPKVLHCLSQERNVSIHALTDKINLHYRFSRYVRSLACYPKDVEDSELLEVIRKLHEKKGFQLLLPVDDKMIRFVCNWEKSLKKFVRLPLLPSIDSITLVSNKIEFARYLEAHRISGPEFQVLTEPFSSKNLKISYPLLSKPYTENESGSGKGIQLFKCSEEVDFLSSKNQGNRKTFFVQKYVDGTDVDCSVLCFNGEILEYTIQTPTLPGKSEFSPHFGVRLIQDDEVLAVTRRLMKSLNWSGVAHIDLRYDKTQGDVKVIEVNGRFWASLEASLYGGMNFPYLYIQHSLKNEMASSGYKEIEFFNLRGTLKKIKSNPFFLVNFPRLWKVSPIKFIVKDPLPWIVGFRKRLLK
ncbi:MAG: ATP-grasp domain-containing protein [Bacteroidota bacterium]